MGILQYSSSFRSGDTECCVFPFVYNGLEYDDCTTVGKTKNLGAYEPWCATSLKNGNKMDDWEYCKEGKAQDCRGKKLFPHFAHVLLR